MSSGQRGEVGGCRGATSPCAFWPGLAGACLTSGGLPYTGGGESSPLEYRLKECPCVGVTLAITRICDTGWAYHALAVTDGYSRLYVATTTQTSYGWDEERADLQSGSHLLL